MFIGSKRLRGLLPPVHKASDHRENSVKKDRASFLYSSKANVDQPSTILLKKKLKNHEKHHLCAHAVI